MLEHYSGQILDPVKTLVIFIPAEKKPTTTKVTFWDISDPTFPASTFLTLKSQLTLSAPTLLRVTYLGMSDGG